MYIKRPLSYVALFFSILIFLFISIFPIKANFDIDEADNTYVTAVGKVSFKDNKNGNIRVYLEKAVIRFGHSYDSDVFDYDYSGNVCEANGLICELSEEEYDLDDVKIGQEVRITGDFNCYDAPVNEGQFDMRSYYLIRGYEGRIRKGTIEAKGENYSHIKEKLFLIKMKAERVFCDYMNEDDSGIMCALVLGDKTELNEDVKDLYQNAGISHILSLSGLHIASVGLCILSLLKRSGISSVISNIISSVVMILYAIMTGMSTSTKRALIMFLLAIAADILGKTYDILSAASFAYICTLISNPYYLKDSGFLLSFGAILGISIFYPAVKIIIFPFKRKIKGKNIKIILRNWTMGLVESLLVTLSITLSTLPITASTYYRISRYSFICNPIVIPLVGIVLASGIISALIGIVLKNQILNGLPFAGHVCAFICGNLLRISSVILNFYEYIATKFSELPYNSFVIGKPSRFSIIIYVVFMILVLALAKIVEKITHTYRIIDRNSLNNTMNNMWNHGKKYYKITPLVKLAYLTMKNSENIRYLQRYTDEFDKEKKKIFVAIRCIFIVTATFSLLILTKNPVDEIEIRNLSIGQGDCSVIFGKNTPVIIVDGGSSDVKQAGKYRLEPVLLSNGVNKVDYIFLSHLDSDHTSAVFELLDDRECGLSVKNVVIPKALLETDNEEINKKLQKLKTAVIDSGCHLFTMNAGDGIKDGDITIKCIWPYAGSSESADDNQEYNSNGNYPLDSGYEQDANSMSMVLMIENPKVKFKAIFTGDVDIKAEEAITNVDKTLDTKIDYLKVAHHGSNGSSSDVFLNKVSPTVSVISCGLNNTYNHPGEDTLERLSQIKGNHIFRTDLQGEVMTKVDKNGKISVSSFLVCP